jgi:hypothetical protein
MILSPGQYFQPGIGITTERPDGSSDQKSDHVCSRNGNPHAVFHQVG